MSELRRDGIKCEDDEMHCQIAFGHHDWLAFTQLSQKYIMLLKSELCPTTSSTVILCQEGEDTRLLWNNIWGAFMSMLYQGVGNDIVTIAVLDKS